MDPCQYSLVYSSAGSAGHPLPARHLYLKLRNTLNGTFPYDTQVLEGENTDPFVE